MASAYFVARGPVRAISGSLDFAAPYAAAKAWVGGQNPYAATTLDSVLLQAGREASAEPRFTPSLYPPGTFVVLAPVSLLQWPAARLTWLAFCLALFALHIPALLRLGRLKPTDTRGLILIASVLALAPYGTAFALGQLATASIALVVIAIERIERDSRVSGAALALATLLKPQIGAWFIAYYFVRDRRRAAAEAAALVLVATLIGVAVLWTHNVDWIATWTANSRSELAGGALDPAGPLSAQMIDLRPLLTALGLARAAIWISALLALFVIVALYLWGRRVDREHELLLLANVAVVLLFIGYHRFYDAALLCLPLAWAIRSLRSDAGLRVPAIAAASCCVPFVVPGAWMLHRLAVDGTISASVTQTFFWNPLVLRHQIWSLLLLQLALLIALKSAAGSARHSSKVSAPVR